MLTLVLLFGLALLTACGSPASSSDPNSDASAITPFDTLAPLPPERKESTAATRVHPEAIGSYAGAFEAAEYDENADFVYANKITIFIDSFNVTTAFGHSVVAGNLRSFSGPYKEVKEGLEITGKEPGDDRYDGVFTFVLNSEAGLLKGTWKANNNKLPVTGRTYELKYRRFAYNPNLDLPEDVLWDALYEKHAEYAGEGEFLTQDVFKYNPSKEALTRQQVENMYKGDLEVMRNAIYARHGYSFKNRKMRFIFDRYVEWYMPVSTDIRGDLTPLEKKNIDLMKRYEEHADRYYDVFGR